MSFWELGGATGYRLRLPGGGAEPPSASNEGAAARVGCVSTERAGGQGGVPGELSTPRYPKTRLMASGRNYSSRQALRGALSAQAQTASLRPQFRTRDSDAKGDGFFLKEKRRRRARWAPVPPWLSGRAHEAGRRRRSRVGRAGPRRMASFPVTDASRRRREKRRQLDARRSKCRIRLGGHMEQWCLLKERLGFSLHSQLAKFLLDRYTSSGCVLCAGREPLPHKGLQYLVLLSHAHSRECSLVPGLRTPGSREEGLVWECSAGHTFSWEPSLSPTPSEVPKQDPLTHTAERTWYLEARRQEPGGLESEQDRRTQEDRLPRRVGPSLETFPPPGENQGGEEDEDEDEEMLSDASPWTYSSSPDDEADVPRPPPSPVTHTPKEGETPPAPAALPAPCAVAAESASPLGSAATLAQDAEVHLGLSRTPQVSAEQQETELLASPGSQAQSAPTLAWDEDTAQIGPRRIRKAAKRELMPCDFPGCGRIFSNRQYLNHHKKYQHIHQKSFCCPEPACGKAFNFKKHLKEHVKLHSDTRDYICEFCARSFRTSSNLVIHRRIHTGEKPLQCEICGFTCRQKASLNWHRRKHAETAAALRFPCEFCGKRFEKPDSVAAHRSKSHPALVPQEQPGSLDSCPSISAPEAPGLATEGPAPSTVSFSSPGDPRD